MAKDPTQRADLLPDAEHEGREDKFMDIDRMVNDGLSNGRVSMKTGRIGDSTTDYMDNLESIQQFD